MNNKHNYNELLDEFAHRIFSKPYILLSEVQQAEVEETLGAYLFNQDSKNVDHIQEEIQKQEMTLVMFEELLKPENLVQQFSSLTEFKEWMSTGYLEDLKEHLEDFEKAEYYEYCVIIRDIINERELELELEKMGVDISAPEQEAKTFRGLEN